MKKTLLFILAIGFASTMLAQDAPPKSAKDTLVVVWSSGDPDVAEKVCFMYAHNAKKWGWFDEVKLIVWGPSAKLAAENEDIQKRIKAMIEDGVVLEACVACARMYEADDNLRELGIDVKGMGTPLTKYLKAGYSVLNF